MPVFEFEYLEVLGEGTSGMVYRARDARGRDVAVKLFRASVAGDPALLKRFRREVAIATTLEHEALVTTYEGGRTASGRLFLSTELVRGGDLHRLEAGVGPLEEEAALSVMRDLLLGLAYLDERRLVHRDVKPENILLAEDGTAKLGDFGLAKIAAPDGSRVTVTGEVIGTPYYLAPEQIRGARDVDIRADLYAAGVVFFEMLAGRPPFDGPTVVDIVGAHLGAPVPDIAALRPGISAQSAWLVENLLRKERLERPGSPAAVLEALDGVLEDPRSGHAAVRAALWHAVRGRVAPPVKPRLTLSSQDALVDRTFRSPRVALSIRTASEAVTLLVFAGDRLALGRDGIERSENDVCLRVRGPGAEEASRRISSQHLVAYLEGPAARVRDLATRAGTRVDGMRLPAGATAPLRPLSTISIAGVLELEARTIPGPRGEAAALLLSRPQNGAEQAYLLLRERAAIGARGGAIDIGPAGGGAGALELAAPPPGEITFTLGGRSVAPGDVIEAPGLVIEVREIRPEEMK
jgi:serine/threonine-protein kinase